MKAFKATKGLTVGFVLLLMFACGSEKPVQPQEPPAAPVEKALGEEAPGDGAPAGSATASKLRSHGDRSRKLIREIRALTLDLKKLASNIEANTEQVYAQKHPQAIQATTTQIQAFKKMSRELDVKTSSLKRTIAAMEKEIAALK